MIGLKRSVIFIITMSLLLNMMASFSSNVEYSYAAKKKIHLKKTKVSIVVKKTYQQKLIDKKGKTIKATKVKWKSKKKSVAKISKKGKITAVKAGTAKMTAKYKGKTYKFTVKVKVIKATGVKFSDDESLELNKGDTYRIKASVVPSNATNKKITWSSSDESIVTVDQNGNVTAVDYGFCDISAVASGGEPITKRIRVGRIFTDTDTVDVRLNETVTVDIKSQYSLMYTAYYNNKVVDLKWGELSSSDDNVFSRQLQITGKGTGSYTIRIESDYNPNLYTILHVNVIADIDTLYDFINTYGTLNEDGYKEYIYRYDTNLVCRYTNKGDIIEFYMAHTNSISGATQLESVTMEITRPSSSTVKPSVFFFMKTDDYGSYSLKGEAQFVASSYTENSNVPFNMLNNSFPKTIDAQEICNDSLSLAMAVWNNGLVTKMGMSLKDIGFTNYL